jgi:nucleosome assembly protein 1-like 1
VCAHPSRRPQVPSTLSEEVEEEDGADASVTGLAGLVSNPAFGKCPPAPYPRPSSLLTRPMCPGNLVNDRLANLVGRSSGYVESLPLPIRRRITGLKGIQVAQSKIEAEFQKDIYELEKKYADKYRPLFARRKELVDGSDEPNAEEVESGEQAEDEDSEMDDDDEDEDEDEERERLPVPTADEIANAPKGIPEFWLTALKNHLGLSELITDRDEEALKYLIDIRLEYPADKPGFTLIFEFSAAIKAFFANTKLEKTYYYQDEVGYEGDFVYDHAVGTDIKWVDGKDLTVRIETKKQRNKSESPRPSSMMLASSGSGTDESCTADTNQTRIVKKVVPTDSFFSFFNPPKPPTEDDDEEDEDEDIDEKLEMDYQIGEDLKERVSPISLCLSPTRR